MALTAGQSNVLRGELAGSAIAHTNDPILLEDGESFTSTYDLSSPTPTVSFSGTLKVVKSYDPATDKLEVYPYFQPVAP